MQLIIGKLPATHAAVNAERRITDAGRSLRCNCENCAAIVGGRWETRAELRRLRKQILPAFDKMLN